MTEYERAANEKRGHILEQIEDAGILERVSAYDRQLLLKLLVWDEPIINEYGQVVLNAELSNNVNLVKTKGH